MTRFVRRVGTVLRGAGAPVRMGLGAQLPAGINARYLNHK